MLLAKPKARINIADLQKDRWFTQGKDWYQRSGSGSKFDVTKEAEVCESVQV